VKEKTAIAYFDLKPIIQTCIPSTLWISQWAQS